ncbi:MAG: hypothetical protein QNI95_13525, partial [Desulfobacterales bacterium]|nr:hypothetical protein [Desulfobacterales bacterium]
GFLLPPVAKKFILLNNDEMIVEPGFYSGAQKTAPAELKSSIIDLRLLQQFDNNQFLKFM